MEKTITFQDGVARWLLECFGPAIAADKTERADRFIEGEMHPCSRCQFDAFRAWADSRRPKLETAGAA